MTPTDPLKLARDALARIDVATVGAQATNSRDVDDWRDDIAGIQQIVRATLAATTAAATAATAGSGPFSFSVTTAPGVPFTANPSENTARDRRDRFRLQLRLGLRRTTRSTSSSPR